MIVNITGSHLVAMFNGISVFWHVLGVAIIVGILIFAPTDHASVHDVFTQTQNNSGFSHSMFWWYVLPLGFLLTQYTITGFDASAHVSEETHDAAMTAPRGVWQSVFYSAVIGYIVLLAITFAAGDANAVNEGGGTVFAVFESTMTTAWVKTVLIIALVGQLFCGMSCLTSASRMMYAFSRDGAVPGSKHWSRVNARKIPFNAVIACAVLALILTLPALKGNKDGVTVAFTAVVSIGVIGLYVCWAIPIYLRWRKGDAFEAGPVEPRQEVQVDGADRAARDPDRRDHLLQPAVQLVRRPVGERLRVVAVQLHAGRHRRPGARHRHLVVGQREELVHRPAAHDRRDRREIGAPPPLAEAP